MIPYPARVAQSELSRMIELVNSSRLPVDVSGLPNLQTAEAIHQWLRTHTPTASNLEAYRGVILHPGEYLRRGEADCKGHAMLAVILGRQAGYQTGFRSIGRKANHCWEHVVAVFKINGQDVIIDPSAERIGEVGQVSGEPLCVGSVAEVR